MNTYQLQKKTYLIKFNNNRLKIYTAKDYGDLLGLIFSLHSNNFRKIVLIEEIISPDKLKRVQNIILEQDKIINQHKGEYLSFQDMGL